MKKEDIWNMAEYLNNHNIPFTVAGKGKKRHLLLNDGYEDIGAQYQKGETLPNFCVIKNIKTLELHCYNITDSKIFRQLIAKGVTYIRLAYGSVTDEVKADLDSADCNKCTVLYH